MSVLTNRMMYAKTTVSPGGVYRVNIRHGVSRLRSGRRYTLGIIFHDAR